MSHGKIRQEKNCLNCGHIVDQRYCPNCGQENTENRQPFHYLFTHFFEDFTHYDGQFWKTLKYLLFFPGKLSKLYLSGKRQQYVPPVKLYIFISFVTFFAASFMHIGHFGDSAPVTLDSLGNVLNRENSTLGNANLSQKDSAEIQEAFGSIANSLHDTSEIEGSNSPVSLDFFKGGNLARYDSVSNANPSLFRDFFRPYAKKAYELREQNVSVQDILKGFFTVFMHTFPKALFLYLPFFAFTLYLFHNKKKWWYFDHGVFTLHYFSFLLFLASFFLIINLLGAWLDQYVWFNSLVNWLHILGFFYGTAYFFIAHHKFYKTRKSYSIIIGTLIFFINVFAFSILLLILSSISFLLMH